MDTDVTLEVFINNGIMDKALARDVKEEMSNSGKELWETLVDFGVIGGPEDFWQIIATEVGAQFISLEGFIPRPRYWKWYRQHKHACTEPCP